MKFLGKCMYLEDIILSEFNPITEEVTWYSFTDKWILAQKPRVPKIQFPKHKKIKKEDQRVDNSFLLRIGNKIPMEGVTETKFGAKTKGWTIQRLPHRGIHSIISHLTQTLLHTLARFYRKDPDVAISCETMLGPSKHRSGCSQPANGWLGASTSVLVRQSLSGDS